MKCEFCREEEATKNYGTANDPMNGEPKTLYLCESCASRWDEQESDIKKELEKRIKELAESVKNVKCPCCGEMTSDWSAINDPDDEYRDIVTCEVNGCEFYLTEYTDGSIQLEPRL